MHYGRFEAIDTRAVFWIYAALAWALGAGLIAWGYSAALPFLGSMALAAGCCAAAMAAVDDPRLRRRGLLWFAAAHTAVWLVALFQHPAFANLGLAVWVEQSAFPAFALAYVAFTAEGEHPRGQLLTVFSGPEKHLRSEYEEQIRQAAAQEERNRLARDLHDSIKQQLFAIQTAAATAQARAEGDPAGAGEALDRIRSSTREAMAEMEAMTDQLRAEPLGNAGFVEALKQQCEALGFRTGAHVDFRLEGDLPPGEALPPGAHQAMLRAAQEALANVARHARARNVHVSLRSVPGRLELQIRDDGAGFDPNQNPRGMGISNMRARAEELGAQFELASRPGEGASVRFSVPYAMPETPREYLRLTILSGFLLAFFSAFLIWRKQYAMTLMCLMPAIQFLRSATAYFRARRRSEAAR
jgi:signal transduction histidine kinase